jgi:hypothetical protein
MYYTYIFPGPALAPDEDGFHLWGHHFDALVAVVLNFFLFVTDAQAKVSECVYHCCIF